MGGSGISQSSYRPINKQLFINPLRLFTIVKHLNQDGLRAVLGSPGYYRQINKSCFIIPLCLFTIVKHLNQDGLGSLIQP